MGAKRKHNTDPDTTDVMLANAAQELHRLIVVLLKTLDLPFPALKSSSDDVSNEIRVLGLNKFKRMPRLQPQGCVYCSDLALRLFFSFWKLKDEAAHRELSSKANNISNIDNPQKLAVLCVNKLNLELSRRSYRYVVRVWLPGEKELALGAIYDRILVQIREFAECSNVDAVNTAQLASLNVIFRDDTVIVVDKVANMLSVDGTDPDAPVSVYRRIATVYPEARMVHRLDQETSGLLVVALTKSAAQSLNAQFRARSVEKIYLARVCGWMDEKKEQSESLCCVRIPMEKHPTQPLIQHVVTNRKIEPSSSLWSVTEYSVQSRAIETDGDDDDRRFTIVELKPVTGKTHQLRLHMQYLGHPILGDSLYSPDLVYHRASRLCLHAAKLSFTHPVTSERMSFKSFYPTDFFTIKEDKVARGGRPRSDIKRKSG